MPGKWRVGGDQAMLFLASIRERLTIMPLDEDEYFRTVEDASTRGLAGGAIYDALLARCALIARAQTIYTWNVRRVRWLSLPGTTGELRAAKGAASGPGQSLRRWIRAMPPGPTRSNS